MRSRPMRQLRPRVSADAGSRLGRARAGECGARGSLLRPYARIARGERLSWHRRMPDPSMPARFQPHPNRLAIGFALGLLVLSCAACGRRGALEPPDAGSSDRNTVSQGPASSRALPQGVGLGGGSVAPDPEAVRDGDEVSAAATAPGLDSSPVKTSRGGKRGYTIPKQPFLLDPIL